jgi:methionine-R-sulfoxide reductase
MQVSADWEYDPAARVVRPQDSGPFPVVRTDEEWHSLLSAHEYVILRQQGTEYAFTGALNDNHESGIYYSRATGQPLFSSGDKYDSGTGWPSFTKPINPVAIVYREDHSLFGLQIEVVDSLSGSHLGHVFPDGPPPARQRYCINSASLIFVPNGGEPPAELKQLWSLLESEM